MPSTVYVRHYRITRDVSSGGVACLHLSHTGAHMHTTRLSFSPRRRHEKFQPASLRDAESSAALFSRGNLRGQRTRERGATTIPRKLVEFALCSIKGISRSCAPKVYGRREPSSVITETFDRATFVPAIDPQPNAFTLRYVNSRSYVRA